MSKRRAVITGLGWVTSLGNDVTEVWGKLLRGTSGIGPITRFDTEAFPTRIGGEVTNWDHPHIPAREAKRLFHGCLDARGPRADDARDRLIRLPIDQ